MRLFTQIAFFLLLWGARPVVAADSACLGPLLRQREMEELILKGSVDAQDREAKQIVAWFRSHAIQIDEWLEKKRLTPEEQNARQALAAEMHQKLREWSLIMQLTRVTRSSVVLAESAESVLELYLKVIGAAPVIDPTQRTLSLGKSTPALIKKSPLGNFLRSVKNRKVQAVFSLEAFPEEGGALAWVRLGKSPRAAFSHRALAELAPGASEVHEMAHIVNWAHQMQNRDQLFAGWFYDASVGDVSLDEFVAHAEAIRFQVSALHNGDAGPLRRLEWVRGIQTEAMGMLEDGKVVEPLLEQSQLMVESRGHFGVDIIPRKSAPGVPPGDDVEFDFMTLPPAIEEKVKDRQFVLEFPKGEQETPKKRIVQRLEILRSYLKQVHKPLEELLDLAHTAEYAPGVAIDLSKLDRLWNQIEQIQKQHRTRYEGSSRSRHGK